MVDFYSHTLKMSKNYAVMYYLTNCITTRFDVLHIRSRDQLLIL